MKYRYSFFISTTFVCINVKSSKVINIQGDPPIVIKFRMSNSLLKTKQEIILTKCCANNSFQTIKHCNLPIETHHFRTPISFLCEFFTKIHFRSVEKYFLERKQGTMVLS